MKKLHWLKKPYPFISSFRQQLLVALFFAVFIFLFLLYFQPFGLSDSERSKTLYILGFALITFSAMLINYALVPRVFPGLFVLDEWMVGKHVLFGLWNIILIAFLNFLYYAWLEDYAISPTKIFSFIIITTSVGIFPLTLMVFINEFYLSDRHNRHASVLNQKLESLTQVAGENHNQKILLRGSSENDSLELLENDLLYIQAMENYCLVHFLGQGRLVKHLLRSSLKNIDDQLEAFPHMLRCHRSYLVNRKNISRISGNARAYAIHFEVSDETIPVSRTINKDQLLNSIS